MRRITKKNINGFKPTIRPEHCLVFKWLINEGYTVAYLSNVFNVNPHRISGLFLNPHKLTVNQVCLILLLLKDSKHGPSDILSSLLRASVKIGPEVEDIYRAIKLPETDEQVYRTDFDPKEYNLRH